MITEKFVLENKGLWKKYRKEINELDKDILRDLIIEDPDIIDFIDLDKLEEWNIPYILKYQPKLIKDLRSYLYKLAGHDMSNILVYQPKLIKDLKPFLDKLDGDDMSYVLLYQPKLIKDIKPYLDKLDETDKRWVLTKRPEFSLFFKYLNTEYEDAAYYCACPSEISKLDEEEKQELSKKIAEIIRKEKR